MCVRLFRQTSDFNMLPFLSSSALSQIGWAATVSWQAGDATCRIFSFFRTFGLYLSGFLLVCISLDRYFAVLKPLSLPEANKRGRYMLYAAWTGSFLCSFPQVQQTLMQSSCRIKLIRSQI